MALLPGLLVNVETPMLSRLTLARDRTGRVASDWRTMRRGRSVGADPSRPIRRGNWLPGHWYPGTATPYWYADAELEKRYCGGITGSLVLLLLDAAAALASECSHSL